MNPTIKWYIESIEHELERLESAKFTGNIEFQLNFKDSMIANCNVILRKSVRRETNVGE